jgi:hypothetical protein
MRFVPAVTFVLAAGGLGAFADADAQATRGRDLWYNAAAVKSVPGLLPCSSCHVASQFVGRSAATIQTAINVFPTMAIYRNGVLSLSPDMTDLALFLANPAAVPVARATVSPGNLAFPAQASGTTSATMTLTVSHDVGSGEPFVLAANNAISIAGTHASQFQIAGGTCTNGLSVAVGSNCTVLVRFAPVGTISVPQGEPRSAQLTVAFATPAVAPIQPFLAGTAVAAAQPSISLSKTALAFPATPLGSTVNDSLVLTNNGGAPLALASLATAGANAADFTRSGSCVEGASVAAGGSCTIAYAFAPAALGARSATLTIGSNNAAGNVSLQLTGSGVSNTPVFSATPLALTFSAVIGSTSAAQNVTVRNTGGGTLSVASVASSSGAFVATANGCAALTNNQACTIGVTFAPVDATPVSGTLTVNHNAGVAGVIALTGAGQTSAPAIAAAPVAVNFTALTAVGQQSVATTVRLTNNGPGAVTLAAATAAAEFPLATTGVANPCSNGLTIAQGAFCQVAVRFAPSASGTRSGSLTFSTNGNPANLVVPLLGNATATAAPEVGYTPAGGPVFAVTRAGTTSEAIRVTVTNRGTANMVFPASAAAAINTGFNPSDFRVEATTCVAASNLAPNTGNCTIDLVFAPPAAGAVVRSAILTVSYTGGSAQVPLMGVVDGATGTSATTAPPATGGSPAAAPGSGGGGGALPLVLLSLLAIVGLLRRAYTRRRVAHFAGGSRIATR